MYCPKKKDCLKIFCAYNTLVQKFSIRVRYCRFVMLEDKNFMFHVMAQMRILLIKQKGNIEYKVKLHHFTPKHTHILVCIKFLV